MRRFKRQSTGDSIQSKSLSQLPNAKTPNEFLEAPDHPPHGSIPASRFHRFPLGGLVSSPSETCATDMMTDSPQYCGKLSLMPGKCRAHRYHDVGSRTIHSRTSCVFSTIYSYSIQRYTVTAPSSQKHSQYRLTIAHGFEVHRHNRHTASLALRTPPISVSDAGGIAREVYSSLCAIFEMTEKSLATLFPPTDSRP
jgi:hypothetical protein